MAKIKLKKQKNPYRRLNSAIQIAKTIGQTRENIDKTYYNPEKPHKFNMGKALDIGVFIMRHDISIDEVVFMVDFIKSHKEYIKSKL